MGHSTTLASSVRVCARKFTDEQLDSQVCVNDLDLFGFFSGCFFDVRYFHSTSIGLRSALGVVFRNVLSLVLFLRHFV